MTQISDTREMMTGSATLPVTVKVWDPFVRVFHWSLVALVLVAFATGDDFERIHIAAGYAILGLIGLRVVWGFIGPRYARFGDFVRSPRDVSAYLHDVARSRAPRYLGHNPAGGAMILILVAMLLLTGGTGYMMTTDAFWGSKWVEDVHEVLANLTLALIGIHVVGVIVSSLLHGENLIMAMLTGRKRHD